MKTVKVEEIKVKVEFKVKMNESKISWDGTDCESDSKIWHKLKCKKVKQEMKRGTLKRKRDTEIEKSESGIGKKVKVELEKKCKSNKVEMKK